MSGKAKSTIGRLGPLPSSQTSRYRFARRATQSRLVDQLSDASAAGLMRDTILLYIGAVGQEVGAQWAARGATPCWSSCLSRLTETRPAPATQPDGNPGLLFNDVQPRLRAAMKMQLSPAVTTKLGQLDKNTDYKDIGAASTGFLEQYGMYPNQDMPTLTSYTLHVAFGLERLGAGLTDAFAGGTIDDLEVRNYILGPLGQVFDHLTYRMALAVKLLGGPTKGEGALVMST